MNRFTLRPMSAVSLAALFVGVACTGGCSLFNKSSGQPQAQAAAAPAPAVAAAAPAQQQQQQPAEAVLAGDISSPQTGIATWKSVAELRQDLIRSRAQVDSVLDALGQLNTQGGGDLRPAYDEFNREVNATQAQSQRMRQQSETIRAKGREFFRTWQEQSLTINDPAIRGQADQRQSSVRSDFNRIVASMQKTRDTFGPFMNGLVDIRQYLATDLTPRGVGAIDTAIRKAKDDGSAVQKQLDAVVAELDRAAAELTPTNEARTAEAQQQNGQAGTAAAAMRGSRAAAPNGPDANAAGPADAGNK